MSTLLEIEHAVYRSLVTGDDSAVAPHIVVDGLAVEARLDVYRNTFIGVLTTALRLSFPAVHRLVGAAFFERAARVFIEGATPRSACLDDYGAEFPEFLSGFPPANALAYLPCVARLEWAVSRALHAPDTGSVNISDLSTIRPEDHGRIIFAPHPSLGIVEADYPADQIWSAVLAQDDTAMAAVDLDSGPVKLLVQRFDTDIDVTRLRDPAWRFITALYAGKPLATAIETAPDLDVTTALARHLAVGRFVGVELADPSTMIS